VTIYDYIWNCARLTIN